MQQLREIGLKSWLLKSDMKFLSRAEHEQSIGSLQATEWKKNVGQKHQQITQRKYRDNPENTSVF